MHKLAKVDKKKEVSSLTNIKGPELSKQFKEDLEKVREEVKKGKYTRYKNSKDLAKDIGL